MRKSSKKSKRRAAGASIQAAAIAGASIQGRRSFNSWSPELRLGRRSFNFYHRERYTSDSAQSTQRYAIRDSVAILRYRQPCSRKCVAGLSTEQHVTDRYPGFKRDYVYLAPECDRFNYKASQEADVYAFGVVFLEVLCERSAWDNLRAFPFIMKGELARFTPEHVRTCISRECAQACENLLRDCLDSDLDKRPFMNQVVEKLEIALKLQKEGANY